jgi:hypothetical protein
MDFLFSTNGSTTSTNGSATAVDQKLKALTDDFSRAASDLMDDGDTPSKSSLNSFFDKGSTLYSFLTGNAVIPPRERTSLWLSAIGNLKGNQALLAQCISHSGGGEPDFRRFESVLTEYRKAFVESFDTNGSDAAIKLSRYLDAESFLIGKVFLSASCYSGHEYFDVTHNIILDGERFIGELLPSVPKDQGKGNSPQYLIVPPLWDEAVTYRLKLFLWRALIFAGHKPVADYLPLPYSEHTAFSDEEYSASVDSGYAILQAVQYLISQGTIEESHRKEIETLVADVSKVIQDDEKCTRSIAAADKVVSENKNAPTDFVNIARDAGLSRFLSLSGDFIRNISNRISNFGAIPTQGISGRSDPYDKKKIVYCSVIVARRTYWFSYPLVILENTLIQRDTYLRTLPINFIDFLEDFLRNIQGCNWVAPYIESSWTGPAINARTLSEIVGNVALMPLKATRPELLYSREDGSYFLPTLSWTRHYTASIIRISHSFRLLPMDTEKESMRTGRESTGEELSPNVLNLFFARFDDSLSPLIDKNSLLHNLLVGNRLLLGNTNPSPESMEKSMAASRVAFDTIKLLIQKDGGSACPFDPHIGLLVDIIEKRWPELRKTGAIDHLFSEAAWIQETFEKTIETDVKRVNEESRRARLFCLAAANIGHVYLLRGDEEGYLKQLPFIKRALAVIPDPESSLYAPLEAIIARNKL